MAPLVYVPADVVAVVVPVYCARTRAVVAASVPEKPPLAVPLMLVTVLSGEVTAGCKLACRVLAPFVSVSIVGEKVLLALGEMSALLPVRTQSTVIVNAPPPLGDVEGVLVHVTLEVAGTDKLSVLLVVPEVLVGVLLLRTRQL